MSFQHIEGVGTVHFQDITPARVVPGHERHRWDGKPGWGESTTCKNCKCVKHRQKPEYVETFQMPGGPLVKERPACTGPKKYKRRKK